MRRVMVRVLPVPAPASTHTGPRAASDGLALLVVEVTDEFVARRGQLDRHARPSWQGAADKRPERVASGMLAVSDTLKRL